MIASDFFFLLPNPQVYTGREINAVHKPSRSGDVRICLAFPDTYEIGMSHAGIKILYHFLNDMPGVVAERAFLPDRQGAEVFRAAGVPLFSLESRTPLDQFDAIGISLMSELNFTNVLLLLDLARIPLYARERTEGQPLIVAGGIAAANPEPMRDFIDCFAFGDGEVLFPALIEALRRNKKSKKGTRAILDTVDKLEGFFVPACHPPETQGAFLVPQMQGKKVAKAVHREFKRFAYKEREIIPITNVVFNRLNVELARGCPQHCRFCQARAYYSPYRIRDRQETLRFICGALGGTGYESFSLSALSAGDYPHLGEILSRIPDLIGPGVSFSVPSLRPSLLSDLLLETIGLFRRTGITIVPEAGSARLRRAMNKNVGDSEIAQAVELALAHGWQRIKMYFMIGLPGEGMADIEAIVGLLQRLSRQCRERKRSIRFHISFSPFVPKPHTPFQWMKSEPLESLREKIQSIRSGLGALRNMELDFHSPEKALVETVLARGDCRAGRILFSAYQQGETFTAWEDGFHFPVWQHLLEEHGLGFLLGEFPLDAVFPWDFLRLDRSREFLQKEARAAWADLARPVPEATVAPPTKTAHFRPLPVQTAAAANQGKLIRNAEIFEKFRIFYPKKGDFRFFSHLSLAQYIERLLRRTGLHFKCSEGFHPRVRLTFLPPLPVGAEGEDEVLEVFIAAGQEEESLLQALNQQSEFFKFHKVSRALGCPGLGKDIRFIRYRLRFPVGTMELERIKPHLAAADTVAVSTDGIEMRMHEPDNGTERFARIYRILDPEKSRVGLLVRCGVEFKNGD